MSEPAKKPGQQPESYDPRTPEIVGMVEVNQMLRSKPQVSGKNSIAYNFEFSFCNGKNFCDCFSSAYKYLTRDDKQLAKFSQCDWFFIFGALSSQNMTRLPYNKADTEHVPEWCLIGGYDKKDRLLVNIYIEGIETDKQGYIAVENGLTGSDGLYILHEKQQKMDMAQVYQEAFRAIPSLITMPARGSVSFGQQAYYAWADAMLDDANFADLSDDPRKDFLWNGYMAPWIVALTNECYFRRFFDQVIVECGLPEAVRIKEIYMRIHADLFRMQELHGNGEFDAKLELISTREVREELAAILRHMGDLHNELLELFA